jgi:hypothetical protein
MIGTPDENGHTTDPYMPPYFWPMHHLMKMAEALRLSVPELIERLERGDRKLLTYGEYAVVVADAIKQAPAIAHEWHKQTGL